MENPLDRRKRGHRRSEHFVPRADSDREESELDRGGARRHRNGFADPDVLGKLLFEGARLAGENVTARVEDLEHGPLHLLRDRRSRERNHLGAAETGARPRRDARCSKGVRTSRPVSIDS